MDISQLAPEITYRIVKYAGRVGIYMLAQVSTSLRTHASRCVDKRWQRSFSQPLVRDHHPIQGGEQKRPRNELAAIPYDDTLAVATVSGSSRTDDMYGRFIRHEHRLSFRLIVPAPSHRGNSRVKRYPEISLRSDPHWVYDLALNLSTSIVSHFGSELIGHWWNENRTHAIDGMRSRIEAGLMTRRTRDEFHALGVLPVHGMVLRQLNHFDEPGPLNDIVMHTLESIAWDIIATDSRVIERLEQLPPDVVALRSVQMLLMHIAVESDDVPQFARMATHFSMPSNILTSWPQELAVSVVCMSRALTEYIMRRRRIMWTTTMRAHVLSAAAIDTVDGVFKRFMSTFPEDSTPEELATLILPVIYNEYYNRRLSVQRSVILLRHCQKYGLLRPDIVTTILRPLMEEHHHVDDSFDIDKERNLSQHCRCLNHALLRELKDMVDFEYLDEPSPMTTRACRRIMESTGYAVIVPDLVLRGVRRIPPHEAREEEEEDAHGT
jgi:hypothetical protein